MLIQWKKEFSIGVPSIDQEHEELIELINELHAELESGKSDATIADFLGEIYAQISAHFALEEMIMRENRYDQYDEHKKDHERLLDDIRDMMDDYEDKRIVSDRDLSSRLDSWFSGHFKTHDARLHMRFG
ncbi:MAG: hemerythrin family protein [Gammaproteobacteria bacterium]|nr:hemerythrin family protein [Gammaproteobacteria bacterium]